MNRLDDVARFRANDDPALVAAAFACPLCLGLDGASQWELDLDDDAAGCSCEACQVDWKVTLDAQQAMRVALHPPATRHAERR